MLGDPAALRVTGEITMAAWVRPVSTDGYRNIISKGFAGKIGAEVSLRVNHGKYEVGSWDGRNHRASSPIPRRAPGAWNHVAGLHDGKAWWLYVDGTMVAKVPDATGAIPVAEGWAIGSRGTGTERFLGGTVDDVRVYNRALSAGEVALLAAPERLAAAKASVVTSDVGLARGLVGHWKFDETEGTIARDSSGKGNHGTLVGDAKWTGDRGGRMGGACLLGADGHVTTSVPGPHRTDLTWSAWIKTTSADGTFLANTGGNWQSGGKCLSVRRGKVQPNVCGVNNPDTGFVVNDGAWHHVAFTLVHVGRGRDTFTIYGDGAEMMRNTWDFYRYDGRSLMMRIGYVADMVGAFEGLVDDVRIYDRSLSAREVASLAYPERPVAAGVPVVPADVDIARGLVGWWKFDETGGAVARDSSGKGNDGTLVGGPGWRPAGGRVGGALELDGVDDCVDLVKTSTARAFTAALWVNKISPRDTQCFLARHTAEGGNSIVLGYYYRELAAHSGRHDTRRSGSLPAGWQHAAIAGATAGPGQMKVDLYLNGRRIGTHLFPDAEFKMPGKPWTVGQDWDGNSRSDFLAGLVDEVRIYDRALSAEEVALLADPVKLAAVESAGRAKSEGEERLASLLAEFEAFIGKGDHAGARTFASREAGKRENKPHADALRSAARVANALAKRRDAMRKAAEELTGKQAEFATAKGKLAGTVGRVTDEGIILRIEKKIRGMGTIETRITVKWAELDQKDEARLAKSWRPAGPDGHVALAALALARKDTAAARKALAEAGGHPLSAHYVSKLGAGRGAVTTPKGAAGRPAGTWPPDIETIRRLFKGKLLKWDPKTLRIELAYDFSDQGQAADWTMSKYIVWGGAPRGFTVANGSMELMGSGKYVFHKPSLIEASIEASATVTGGANSPGCLVCADESGNFHCLTGHYQGKAFLESCKGGVTFSDHSPRTPYAIREGTPTRISLGIDRGGRLTGSVDKLSFSSDPVPTLSGHVGLRPFRSNVAFKDVRIKGRFSRPWLEQALGRAATCGLLGTYFETRDFSKPVARRIDPMIDFA
ncbi:MAG: LamG domain-containing protein, partial [Planctomycetota bacterium]